MSEQAQQKKYYPHKWLRYISWTGYMTSNAMEAAIIGYLTFYITDSVLLSAGTAAGILAASRIFDGVSDIIAGYIIDHTRTKWGKARPHSIFSVLMWIAVVLLFSVPNLSTTGKIVYIFITYNLADTVARTMLRAAEMVHYKGGFTDDEQISATGFCGTISGVLSLAVGVILPKLIDRFGMTPEGWRLIAILLAVPGIVLGLMKLFFIPEFDAGDAYEKKHENTPILESARLLFKNKYVLFLVVPTFLNAMAQGLGVATYYFKYIVGDIGSQSIVSIAGLFTMIIMPFLPMMAEKMGIRKSIYVFMLLGAACYVPLLFSPKNIALLFIASAGLTVGIVPYAMFSNVCGIQIMKYTEWREGKQIEGLISVSSGFADKLGRALGAVVTGAVLGMAGYNGSLDMQAAQTNFAIRMLYIVIPMLALLIGGLVCTRYDLPEKMPQIEKELDDRKLQSQTAK